MNSAAARSSTRKGEWLCCWTSHACATVSIQLPTLLANEPSQIQRNAEWRRTANAPFGRRGESTTFTARVLTGATSPPVAFFRVGDAPASFLQAAVQPAFGGGHCRAADVQVGARLRGGALRLEQLLIGDLQIQRGRHARARADVDLLLRPFRDARAAAARWE